MIGRRGGGVAVQRGADAEGAVDPARGEYTVQVLSDDRARVRVDGRLTLDACAPHGTRVDSVPPAAGAAAVAVHYFDAAGFAGLRLTIHKRR